MFICYPDNVFSLATTPDDAAQIAARVRDKMMDAGWDLPLRSVAYLANAATNLHSHERSTDLCATQVGVMRAPGTYLSAEATC